MKRYRYRKLRGSALPEPPIVQSPDSLLDDAPRALFEGDVASQRLFNRAALDQMGDYSAVILASDSLRPAWSEPGDLVHVRRGAEDAKHIVEAVSGRKR
ncbi:hypothetical protein V0U79_11315 [Hyphobacterium sp. HN65]|uniref:Uncharacterized protein n=1 Tax=Hyphobacterium lacteum TaxID=3116575 RepID=A0ABU7LSR8_9PROT|nr:hypothetical protein [Hyphobacterium sp. HN65]MEE2526961.1 hypothetical protein [Hyphobacterium sp. HN65]